MNLFRRELRAHRTHMIIWSAVMIAFLFLAMAKYATLSQDAAASQQLINALPSTLQAVFGMTGLDLTSVQGYYGVSYIFIAVMLAIHAGMLGAEIIAKEEIDKTAEFLYVKPLARAKALTVKISAGLVILLTVLVATTLGTIFSIMSVNHGSVPYGDVARFTLALLIIQLIFYAIGVAAAAAIRRPKRAGALAAIVVFLAYIAYVLQSLSSSFSWLKQVTPFGYFNAKDILSSGSVSLGYIAICLGVTVIAIALGYIRFMRRDFKI